MIDWLFPAECRICRGEGHWWCSGNESALWPLCFACHHPFHPEIRRGNCRGTLPLLGVGHYSDNLRKVIHDWKYDGYSALSADWAAILARTIEEQRLPAAGLVPVPLHWLRRFQRGFNQAEILARQISRRTNLPVYTPLRRTRHVRSQTTLDPETRATNVAHTMAAQALGTGRRVWLIDDVSTTGATLAEARRALRAGGWQVVGAAVIAVA